MRSRGGAQCCPLPTAGSVPHVAGSRSVPHALGVLWAPVGVPGAAGSPGCRVGPPHCRVGCAGVRPVPQPRGTPGCTRCHAALRVAAGRIPQPGCAGAGFAAGWCQARGHTCRARSQAHTAPGLGMATLAPAQAQRFVAGWTVVLAGARTLLRPLAVPGTSLRTSSSIARRLGCCHP